MRFTPILTALALIVGSSVPALGATSAADIQKQIDSFEQNVEQKGATLQANEESRVLFYAREAQEALNRGNHEQAMELLEKGRNILVAARAPVES